MSGQPAYAVIVLAGGAARRLGGVDKPALVVGGESMLHRVLGAAAGADPRVVVGPPRADLPEGVLLVQEEPPGGGPVAATAAGLAGLAAHARPDRILLLAADLPFLNAEAIAAYLGALDDPAVDGALPIDADGRRQLLCGAWRRAALVRRLAEIGAPAGASMRSLVEGLTIAEIRSAPAARPTWFDCDTEEDLRHARGDRTYGGGHDHSGRLDERGLSCP